MWPTRLTADFPSARRCNESTTARSGDDGAAVRQRPGCREKAGGKQAADSTVIPPSAISGVTTIPHAALLEGRATSGATSPTRDTRREASRRASPNGALRTLQLARGKGERELPKLLQSTLDAPPKRTVQAGKAHAHEAEPRRYHRRPARQRSPTRRIEAPPNSCPRRSPVTPFPLKGGGTQSRASAHARAAGIDEPKERGGGRGGRADAAASDSADGTRGGGRGGTRAAVRE